MCGILGTNFDVSDAQFAQAMQTIAHRGPDDSGTWSDEWIRLGHQRLAIVDLSANGHQPMSVLDGQVWLIFNGEIYNHQEIRSRMGSDISYRSTADTETILYAYLKYGRDFVKLLNGIFTIAIYDQRNGELFVARDQLGIKPLYYYLHDGRVAFASELKAVLELPGIGRTEDVEAMANYFHFLWSPGEKTPVTQVKKLLPGHYFTLNLRQPQSPAVFTRYYEIPFNGTENGASENELIDELDEKLFTAVQRQLMSDVPVGFFLSGGLDSSLIAAMARKITGSGFNSYTIELTGNGELDGFVDDLSYAEQVAKHLDINLIRVPGSSDIIRDFDRMIWHLDEPQADPAPLHVWNISRIARENGDVVLLGGTAGDDLFSGYRRHQALNLEKWFRLCPGVAGTVMRQLASWLPASLPTARRLRKLASGFGKTQLRRMADYYAWIDMDRITKLFTKQFADQIRDFQPSRLLEDSLASIPDENRLLNKMLFWDMKFFLADHNLNYTDKMSMAAGVEARVPFLDNDLVDFACQLPVAMKMKGNTTKYLLKKVAERYLPHEVIYRPKTGFGAPVRKWVSDGLFDEKIKILQSRTTVFDPDAIGQLVHDCKHGKFDGYFSVWSALAVDSWITQFASGKG